MGSKDEGGPHRILVQTKEWWNTELEGIVPYNIGDGLWLVSEQAKLAVGSSEALLLQM